MHNERGARQSRTGSAFATHSLGALPVMAGVALGLAAILLAMFTHLTQTPEGILLMAGLGRLAVLILVPARFIVTLHLMKREQKG